MSPKARTYAPVLAAVFALAVAAPVAVAGPDHGHVAALPDPVHHHRDHYRGEPVRTEPRAHEPVQARDPVHHHRDYYRGEPPRGHANVQPGSSTPDAELFYELYART